MPQPESENLSVKLFKNHKQALETSGLVPYLPSSLAQLEHSGRTWYRELRRPQWIWQGVDAIELESILARIANSKKHRSRDEWLDTVSGYHSGNWAYEWIHAGMEHQKNASELECDEAAEAYFKASLYFSVAGYPHIKGDNLAIQSQVLASQAYDMAAKQTSHRVEKILVPYQGRKITCYLHLPNTEKPLPVVIVSGGMDSLQTDMWRLYRDFLAPNNMAMLTLDMPSIGHSSHWPLSEDSSCLHQAVLNYLPNIPWVDRFHAAVMGFRFGGNVALRLSFLEPSRLKACVALGAPVHQILTNSTRLKTMPKMYLDVLASRLAKQVVDINSLTSQMQAWSLKNQGFLSGGRKTSVSVLAIGLKDDPVSPKSDNKLAALFSKYGKGVELNSKTLHSGYEEALKQMIEWIKEEMKQ
ncbi:esterase FrsA [Aliivibrio fischeri]|uniref:esterase FrsA n=1 Tax=Aliivibrio fischeri TaxID=668 RepID=UPI0012DAD4C5|nr:esterase FrsA [Aliivibrio fischeri]MUK70929.1 esterase FrsA [Aliivibrio fischeri]MUK74424.1 esterase FrsA [Aliivibrio fischeri]